MKNIACNAIKFSGFALISAVLLTTALSSPSLAKEVQKGDASANISGSDFCLACETHIDDVAMQKGVHSQVTINASPEVVWKSMRAQRHIDSDSRYVKVIEQNKQDGDVEQSFAFKTMFGEAECVLSLHESNMTQVDYRLKTDSPDFKRFEGRWMLTSPNGKTCTLKLATYAEVYKPLPRLIVNAIMQNKINGQLAMVKTIAEQGATED